MFSKLKRRSENQVRLRGIYASPNFLPREKELKSWFFVAPKSLHSKIASKVDDYG
jgi:hypothetical protein